MANYKLYFSPFIVVVFTVEKRKSQTLMDKFIQDDNYCFHWSSSCYRPEGRLQKYCENENYSFAFHIFRNVFDLDLHLILWSFLSASHSFLAYQIWRSCQYENSKWARNFSLIKLHLGATSLNRISTSLPDFLANRRIFLFENFLHSPIWLTHKLIRSHVDKRKFPRLRFSSYIHYLIYPEITERTGRLPTSPLYPHNSSK